jgi:hypothetical protein
VRAAGRRAIRAGRSDRSILLTHHWDELVLGRSIESVVDPLIDCGHHPSFVLADEAHLHYLPRGVLQTRSGARTRTQGQAISIGRTFARKAQK